MLLSTLVMMLTKDTGPSEIPGQQAGVNRHIRMARGKNTCNIEHYAWVPYL